MQTLMTISFGVLLFISVLIGMNELKKNFLLEMEYAQQGAKCVSSLISTGVERKDIAIVKGKCVVETNAYYKY